MLCFLLLIVLTQVYANPRFTNPQRANITFEAEAYGKLQDYERIYETFYGILGDFANDYENFYPFDRNTLQIMEASTYNGHPVITFGVDGVDCLALQKFLVERRAQKHNLRSVYVSCRHMSFKLCYVFSCDANVPRTTTEVTTYNNYTY